MGRGRAEIAQAAVVTAQIGRTRYASVASGTMCSPHRSTRPEKRLIRNASARFSVSRSGNLTVTILS